MSHAPAALAIYLLGPPRLERNGQPVEVDTRKAIALLAYLALHPERLSRDQLAAFLWPEYDQERAYANLRRTLWSLNKAIGDGWIAADNLTLHLKQQAGIWIDVVEFHRLLTQCRTHGHRGDEVCAACLAPLGQAVHLVRGDFLEGFSLRDSAAFDDWQFFEAESLRKELAATLEKLVRGHSSQQADASAIAYGRRWLALDPLHEPAHRWLMQLYAQAGEQAAALRQYQECVRVLKAELDAPPEAETIALYNRIRNKQIAPRPAKSTLAPIASPQPEAVPVEAIPTPPPAKQSPSLPTPVVEDELRMVTVLCAALTEPLSATQSYPSEQTAQRMKRIFQVAEEILLRYEGRVERFLGEGVVALFGARQLHEDDAERAVRAALELRQAAQAAGLLMSAGITTGYLYISQQASVMTTIGPVANLALRLQATADPDQLLMDEATYRQTRGIAICTPLPVALKGTTQLPPLYQIEQLQIRPQKVRGITGLHAPLVGRTTELTTLQEALSIIQTGEGQLITLIGEAGVGKSRLVSELKQIDRKTGRQGDKETENPLSPPLPLSLSRSAELTSKPCLWLEGRCLEMSMNASYWPFLHILRSYLGWQPVDSEASRAGRIVAVLDRLLVTGCLLAEQREEMGPLLGNLLSIRFGNDWDERLKFAGPEQIRHQTLLALRDFFVALTRQQPVVLVLEDLHWADSLSLDLIALLIEILPHQPLLLLCVYRPDRQHRSWQLATMAMAKSSERFTEIRLRELTPRQSQQLFETLLTSENLIPKMKATLLQKAQGNPLFMEEMIRSWIDAGIIYRQDEVWRVKEAIENVVVPETVQSVILSRIDHLDEGLRGFLQRAAVIGRVFSRQLLMQLIPTGLDLDNAVLALTNHGLIYQERVVPEAEYSFKHVLAQEVVYQNTLIERRQQFHQKVAEAMEQLYADNLTERYEQLAYHYDRSLVVAKAVVYLLKAGEKSYRAYLNDEAVRYYQRGLEWLSSTATSPSFKMDERTAPPLTVTGKEQGMAQSEFWRLAALQGLGQVYLGMGDVGAAESALRQAMTQGRALHVSPKALARLYFQLGEVLWWQARYVERIQIGEEALALLGDDQGSVEAAMINSVLDWGYCLAGDLAHGLTFTFRNAQFVMDLPYVEELRPAYTHISQAYTQFEKNVPEATRWAQCLQEKAEQHHDLRALINAHQDLLAFILESCGDLSGALSHLQKSLQLCTKIGDAKHESDCLLLLGRLCLRLGEIKQSALYTEHGLNLVERAKVTPWITNWYWQLSLSTLCQGDPKLANEQLQRYLQVAQKIRDHREETWGLYYWGRIYLAEGKSKAALQELTQVAARWSLPDMKPFFQLDKNNYLLLLSALEKACPNPAMFHSDCQRLRMLDPEPIGNCFSQWYLEIGQADLRFSGLDCELTSLEFKSLTAKIENGEWGWYNPSHDCSFSGQDGLVMFAANGRNLWQINQSAPRLLRLVAGNFCAQTICVPVSIAQPAIGGLLLWKDAQNYLRLDKGLLGDAEISFRGCLANQDLIIGRGSLSTPRAYLRLERLGTRVTALCSADGHNWFSAGQIDFPVTDPLQIGLLAIGDIDRAIYPGAYTEGTAIRFEAFAVYKPAAALEWTSSTEQRSV